MKMIPVSLYFCPEWWDAHYHGSRPRPDEGSRQALESIYLGRQRFLFERLGRHGVGGERPDLGPGQIATVIRYGYGLVPALLGTEFGLRNAWGFFGRHRTLDEVARLAPVDIAEHPEGEWLRRQRDQMRTRYGEASHCIDIGSVTNNTFEILGADFYVALLAATDPCARLFEVVLETEFHLYRFLRELFPPMDPVPISNCNAHLMGPATYERMVLPFDARQNRFAHDVAAVAPRAAVHHCDVRADDFLAAYARLPGVSVLQASFQSDIAAAKKAIPGSDFSALIHPLAMLRPTEELREEIRRTLRDGAADLALWNIDPSLDPKRLGDLLDVIESCCREIGCKSEASAMPLCWEEIEWAHVAYR